MELLFILPFAIVSAWSFGAMMKTIAVRRNWNPKLTFWRSALLYGLLSYVIPLLYSILWINEDLALMMFDLGIVFPVFLIVNGVLKWQERQKPQSFEAAAREQQFQAYSSNDKATNRLAEKDQPVTDPVTGPMKSDSGSTFAHIFVSYRRSDSADVAGRIYDRLVSRFDRKMIFKDVDSIPLGLDFKEYLNEQVGRCNVLLAVIGDHWLEASDASGHRRLDDPDDFVRIEIESALERNIPVIPLLVRGASMPGEVNLPPSLRKLVYRNGIPIRPDPDFHRDMDRLIKALEGYVK